MSNNDYAAGRNDGWSHVTRQPVAQTPLHQAPADSQQYDQGFADGVTLAASGFNPDGTRR